MKNSISRFELLRGKQTDVIRPPWSIAEHLFVERCTRCDACIQVCDEKIIEKGAGQFPQVNFNLGECSFCEACVQACKEEALIKQQSDSIPWDLEVIIGNKCLAMNRVICRSCAESCDAGAIRFKLSPGQVSRPELNREMCTACGACVAPCPVNAISIKKNKM